MKFYVHHTLIGPESEIVFSDIAAFLNEPGHEKEIIILDMTHWKNMDEVRHRQFTGHIYNLFGDKMISRYDWDATLSEIWAKDQQLIVIYENLTTSWLPWAWMEEFFWLDRYSPWPDVTQEDDLRDSLADNLNCGCGYPGGAEICTNENMLFVSQGILTPDTSMTICGGVRIVGDWLFDNPICDVPIIGSLTCDPIKAVMNEFCSNWEDAPRSVRDLANSATPKVVDWIVEWWRDCKYCARDNLNIIMVDFFEVSNLVKEVRKINQGVYNNKPTVTAGTDLGGVEGNPVVLTAEFSDKDTCDHHTGSIDWGDGTNKEAVQANRDQGAIKGNFGGSHIYADNGTYYVKACVHDGYDEACDTLTVVVENIGPKVDAEADQTVNEGDEATLWATFTDPGFDCPTCVPPTAEDFNATIDWGDSTSESIIPDETPGSKGVLTHGTIQANHVYADDGVYTVKVCVKDDDMDDYLQASCDTITVTVNNVAPTVDAGVDQVIYEGDVLTLDPATFNDKGTLDTHTTTVDWGDGSPLEAGVVSESPFGPPGSTAGADGTVAASHQYLVSPGVYAVTVTVADDDGATTSDTLSVTVLHGFLRFCAYGDDEHTGITVHQDAVAACALVPSGIPGEMRPSGLGSRGEVDVKDRAAIQDILLSLSDKIDVGKDASTPRRKSFGS